MCACGECIYFEAQGVHGVVGGAVERALSGELQGVEELVALDTQRATQLEQGAADPAGPVVHQLGGEENDR